METPFHRGESEVQERIGVREQIEPWARKVVRPNLPEQHRAFYEQLPYLVVAARDETGRPWATLLTGDPGFASSPNAGALTIDARCVAGDALESAFTDGADVGILGIELHTRRRNRVNGRVAGHAQTGFTLDVEQAFGNCPQYIHPRGWSRNPAPASPPRRHVHQTFAATLVAIIKRADTFFIATGHRADGENPAFGMDASHRGGEPGFVHVVGDDTLLIPDYAGNNHFNTLGNLMLDSRAGLLFVDFSSGDMLQLTGHATIEWDDPELASFHGAQRLVRFVLDEAILLQNATALRFDVDGELVRELRVIAKVPASDDVTSFVLEARDGASLPSFAAGQHLPIELELPGVAQPVSRTYSLSNGPSDSVYRLTVKREPHGLVSRHLHDKVGVGDFISASAPSGDFTVVHEGARPIVLLSAGVGITPMVSMLHELAENGGGRAIWFVHGASDGAHHPLAAEVHAVAKAADRVQLHVAFSQPRASDALGDTHQSVGRVDAELLASLFPDLDADYYMCGPTGFMAALQGQLEDRGVPENQIRTETFGPKR